MVCTLVNHRRKFKQKLAEQGDIILDFIPTHKLEHKRKFTQHGVHWSLATYLITGCIIIFVVLCVLHFVAGITYLLKTKHKFEQNKNVVKYKFEINYISN